MPHEPGPAPTAAPGTANAPATWRRVARLFRPHRWAILLVVLLVGVFSALGAALPLLTQAVFDRALFGPGGPDLPLLAEFAALAALAAAVMGAADLAQTWLAARTAQSVVHTLREEMFGRLQRMPLAFFARTNGGEVQSRLTGDTAQVERAVRDTLPEALAGVLGFATAGAAMVALSVPLAAAAVLLAPVVLWVSSRSGRALGRLSAVSQESRARLSSIAAERLSLGGVTLARVHGRQDDERAAFAGESRGLARLQVRAGLTAQLVLSVAHVFFMLTPYLVFLAAGLAREVSAGTLVAFVALQSRLYQPIGQILGTVTDLRSVQGAFERVFGYLDLPAEPHPPAAGGRGPGALAVRRVTFGHPAAGGPGRMALRDVSLDVPAGSAVLVVGRSGSGKTTLGHLLAGLHLPAEGAVLVDGSEVRGPRPGRVCVAPQEPFLFQGSVADNLRYADPDAPADALVRACEIAGIHERIAALPDGYDTFVGERGALLSGGERQRVALARALLSDARVLVLDEATSALDPLTEREVVRAVLAARRGRTTVVVSHRFAALDCFDLVVALDGGRVAEQGAPAELRGAPHGLYARMLRAQAVPESPVVGSGHDRPA
uniref:ABC transporter ATP-binding protein n=1 Tax=Nonomuraea pusilla TaxID=46177 RepID=UPI0006E2D755|nr:ABC transporter ATP-binding protein [Nonomuraea pusilla]